MIRSAKKGASFGSTSLALSSTSNSLHLHLAVVVDRCIVSLAQLEQVVCCPITTCHFSIDWTICGVSTLRTRMFRSTQLLNFSEDIRNAWSQHRPNHANLGMHGSCDSQANQCRIHRHAFLSPMRESIECWPISPLV